MNEETQELGGSPRARARPGLLRRWLAAVRRARRGPALPSSIGRYRVVRKIGEGGMGSVYEAVDEVLGRRIAIKRLKAVDDSGRRRFWREARAAARLSHPNVCPLFEVGEDASGPFLAMELLAGEPLSARLRRGAMDVDAVVALGAGVLAALQAIHDSGLVHRDLKPSNVYLTPHGPRLLDFGLVRAIQAADGWCLTSQLLTPDAVLSDASPITDSELIVGTPGYMAPEQILGATVDGRADLFAAAAVLYEVIAGRRAFPGRTVVEVFKATLHDPPPPLTGPASRLEPVIRRALAKQPTERFATAQEMAEALHAAAKPEPARPMQAPPDERSGALFVGRRDELCWLDERLQAALAGSGGVVFVTGERGAGKTALAGEMLRRVGASGVPVTLAGGRCLEREGPGEALQPFLDALGRLFGTEPGRVHAVELVKTWAPTVGALMPAALVPDPDGSLHRQTAGATRDRLIREAGDFMEAATRLFPTVLLLEDVQWADPVSVELLCHFGRRAARQRFLILCTGRASEVEARNPPLHRGILDLCAAGHGHRLELGPLGTADVEQWLQRRFPGNDFAAPLAPVLQARAEGLPLFVRSLLELLAGRGDIAGNGGGFRLTRPLAALDLEPSKDVKDMVRAHLATLPAAERVLLGLASVLGKEFSSAIARALAEDGELETEERLQRLHRVHRVLDGLGEEELPDGTLGTRYRFAHGLYQRVLYEDLVPPRRAELHRRAGERLLGCWGESAPTRAVEMAEHFERGRDFARAIRLRMRAGEHAARRYAGHEAREHYDRALALARRLDPETARPLEVALLGRRGATQLLSGRFDEAVRDYRAMLERARAARLAAAECEALSALCTAHFYEQRPGELAQRAREAVHTAERLGAPHQLAEARVRAALALVVEGRIDTAGVALDAAVADARQSGAQLALQVGLGQRGFVHYWQCEFAAAEACLREALALWEERGEGFETFVARTFLGLARVNQARISEGVAVFEQAILLARRNGDRFWEPRLVSHLGYVHRELGALAQARGFDTRALDLARESPSPWAPQSDALLNLCVDAARAGDVDTASEYLASAEAALLRRDWMRWMNELRLEAAAAEHFLARGALDLAGARAGRLGRLAAGLSARGYACAAARFSAEIALARGHGEAAARGPLERALQALAELPAPLETWRSRRVLGLLCRRTGDAGAARATFASAARDVDRIAGGVEDASLRRVFLESPAVSEVMAGAGRA